MKVIETSIRDVLVLEPQVFQDQRGYFMESYNRRRYAAVGIDCEFVQDNLAYSQKGVLRGMHYQISKPQSKLVQVVKGEVFDVTVDLRPGSETFGKWVGVNLSAENRRQMYVPEGFAHGYCVISEDAVFTYKCSEFYAPSDEGGVHWSDPDLAIDWPLDEVIVSEKDSRLPRLREISTDKLPAGRPG